MLIILGPQYFSFSLRVYIALGINFKVKIFWNNGSVNRSQNPEKNSDSFLQDRLLHLSQTGNVFLRWKHLLWTGHNDPVLTSQTCQRNLFWNYFRCLRNCKNTRIRVYIYIKNSEERQTKLTPQKFLSHSNNQRTHLKLMSSYQFTGHLLKIFCLQVWFAEICY